VLPLVGSAAVPKPSDPVDYSRDHRPFPSFDHLSLGVGDLARSKAFYDAALAPLGLAPHETIPGEIAYGPPDEGDEPGFAFYIGFEDPNAKRPVEPSAGLHLAFRAPTREAVRAFHSAGLAARGRDLGAPGLRPRYHAHYYGAFLADPDGHHVEAVCHAPE
jgi:catechol 2,3-dioxygenase-like lactoylglutathione lyase family enzyme